MQTETISYTTSTVRWLLRILIHILSDAARRETIRARRLARALHVRTGDGFYFKFYSEGRCWYDTGWNSDGRRDTNQYGSLEELTAAHPDPQPFKTADEALVRYRALVGHLICESLGYFTPMAAAFAVANHFNGLPHHCEYYEHSGGAERYRRLAATTGYEVAMKVLGADKLAWTYQTRHSHKGYMCNYETARMLVRHALEGNDRTCLMSW